MDLSSLLTPWIALAAVLFPLAYAERWIHSHLYGVGWLLTNEPRSATVLYYVILFPGVFVHEFVQWLVAGALNVETERVMVWPEAQEDGTLRLNFVQVKNAGRLTLAIIGAAPLIVGLGLIWYISNHILDFDAFLAALQTGDITVIGPAARELASKPDFYLWLYLMFALANAMLPTPEERSGWIVLLGLFAGVLAFLVIIGVGDVLIETFTGPVAHGVNLLTTAFGTILALQLGAILIIGFFEEILERITKRKFDYSSPEPEPFVREPGSNLPLAPGEPPPSIYNLPLPLPEPGILAELEARRRRPAAGLPGMRPAAPERLASPTETPRVPERESTPQTSPAVPGQPPERQPFPARERPAPAHEPGRPALPAASGLARREGPAGQPRPAADDRTRDVRPGPTEREPGPITAPEVPTGRPLTARPAAEPPDHERGERAPAFGSDFTRKPAGPAFSPQVGSVPEKPLQRSSERRPFAFDETDDEDRAPDEVPDDEADDVQYVDFDDL